MLETLKCLMLSTHLVLIIFDSTLYNNISIVYFVHSVVMLDCIMNHVHHDTPHCLH